MANAGKEKFAVNSDLVGEVEGSPVDAERLAGSNVLVHLHSLFWVDVLTPHQPPVKQSHKTALPSQTVQRLLFFVFIFRPFFPHIKWAACNCCHFELVQIVPSILHRLSSLIPPLCPVRPTCSITLQTAFGKTRPSHRDL